MNSISILVQLKLHKVFDFLLKGACGIGGVHLFLILLSAYSLNAQSFVAQGILPKVEHSGFYRVLITPEASLYTNEQFSNLRIYDVSRKEIPYLLTEEKPIYSHKNFKEYPIIEKRQLKGCCTSLVLSNPMKASIGNISLLIKNAEVSKTATLMGSDDKEEWYAVKEHFIFHPTRSSSGTSEVKVIDFPLINYNFLRLEIDDSTSAPLNILKAGYYDVSTSSGSYTEILPKEVVNFDSTSQKKTYVYLNLDTIRFVDKIELSMIGQPYFLRRAQLWHLKDDDTKPGEKKHYEFISSFEVNSKKASVLNLPLSKTKSFRIVIENDDNPPLRLNFVKVYQLNRYLTTWLEKDGQYKIMFGDKKINRPNYDITFFKDSIPASPLVVNPESIVAIESKIREQHSQAFFTSKYFIWTAIMVVIITLGLMSVRMIRDTSKTE